jgi:hypothetical protein
VERFRRAYGARAVHLALLAGCFAFAGYVIDRVLRVPYAWMIGVYFVAAAILHDFVLFPLDALVDRLMRRVRLPSGHGAAPPLINHIRIPALLSGLLFLMFFPLVLGLGERTYRLATGLDTGPYLGRWLLVTGILFAGSGLLYLGRLWRARG